MSVEVATGPVGPITLIVQVDGKVRAQIEVVATESEADIEAAATNAAATALDGRAVSRAIHVPGKLVNLVTT